RGWAVAWCGWQWDVPRGGGLLGLDAPQALGADGRPLAGQVRVEFRPDAPLADHRLGDAVPGVAFTPYPAADLEEAGAELSVRDHPDGPRRRLPRHRWRFARDEDGRPVADDAHVWLE